MGPAIAPKTKGPRPRGLEVPQTGGIRTTRGRWRHLGSSAVTAQVDLLAARPTIVCPPLVLHPRPCETRLRERAGAHVYPKHVISIRHRTCLRVFCSLGTLGSRKPFDHTPSPPSFRRSDCTSWPEGTQISLFLPRSGDRRPNKACPNNCTMRAC